MIILGIDPGFQISGFGIIKKENKRVILLEHGLLKLNTKQHLAGRIEEFFQFFDDKIKIHGITDVSLETPFFYKNAQNFLKLGYLRGIIYLLSRKNSLQIHEFAPREIKISLTGFGGASKEQVCNVILKLFPSLNKPEKYDITDAIAITLCALWKMPPL